MFHPNRRDVRRRSSTELLEAAHKIKFVSDVAFQQRCTAPACHSAGLSQVRDGARPAGSAGARVLDHAPRVGARPVSAG
ncbi:hypothetical protein GCM10010121_086630 [Streptomyces brasiliensis]|uniref:Uncharacterized protein n=1 Tax=Streptomyces brasiliensis TaxID=1954 RepID=A0A917P5L1_9ACTN|nr:hypothetical protein GCM10010121_086630 [Streptomyces brasiliensis]